MRVLGTEDTVKDPVLLTPFSIIHMISGFIIQRYLKENTKLSLKQRYITTLILHSIYEYKDYYKSYINVDNECQQKIKPDYCRWSDNSFINTIGDTISCLIGQYISENYLLKIKLNKYVFRFILLYIFVEYAIRIEH